MKKNGNITNECLLNSFISLLNYVRIKSEERFGGCAMKVKNLLLSSLFLLAGCSILEQEPIQEEQEVIEDNEKELESEITEESTSEEVLEEPTQEELMIEKLPESASTEDWNLILVGPFDALPEGYNPELVEVFNQERVDVRVEDAWNNWYQAGLDAGHRLFFASGYRSIDLQRNNFNREIQMNMDTGMSEEEAITKAKEFLTEPGHSEHHTGLALDIVDEEWIFSGNDLEPEYETQASQHWLASTMDDYGFILRYPEGKEEITGILYEPWHFRYVGVENAKFIVEHELALEEYLELLALREEQAE